MSWTITKKEDDNIYINACGIKNVIGIDCNETAHIDIAEDTTHLTFNGNYVGGDLRVWIETVILQQNTEVKGDVIATGREDIPQKLLIGNTVKIGGECKGFANIVHFAEDEKDETKNE